MFNFKQFANRPALIEGDGKRFFSYNDLEEASLQFAAPFIDHRALWFLFASNTIDSLIAYLALMNAGHTVALFDEGMHPDLKRQLIELYRPQYILGNWNDTLSLAVETNYKNINSSLPTLKLLKYHFPELSPPLHPDLKLLLSTSGTTGSPKLIRLTSANILSNAAAICEYLTLTSAECAITTLPYHYSYGLSVIHTHLKVGASIVVTTESIVQKSFWEKFNHFSCSSLAGVPHTYRLLDRLGLENLHCPSLLTLTQAGGKLDSSLIAKFDTFMRKRKGRFFCMYGQTEATARIAYLPPDYLPAKAGAIGIAIPGGKLQVFDKDQEITDSHTEGELVYSGPNVMLGYANAPEDLALGDQLHGVLRTGDLGYRDVDGVYYVSGRLKRISKVYGQRINLDEIEEAVGKSAFVAATSDDIVIRLYFESTSDFDIEKCISYLSLKYHLAPSTFECIVLPHLPLTTAGKIDYTKLK